MRPLKPFEVLVEGVRPLTLPQHTVTSLALLARVTKIQPDLFKRTLTAFSEEFGGDPLVSLRERRYMLTPAGWKLFKLGNELLLLGRGEGGEQPSEVVTVEVAAAIDFRYLSDPIRSYHEEYGGLVTVKFVPYEAESIRNNLTSGVTCFGLAFVDPEGASGASLLERPVPWSVIVPGEHTLADSPTPIPVEGLASSTRVFVPAEFAETLTALVGRGSNTIILPTPEAVRAAVAAKLGVGLDLDFGCYPDPEPFFRLPAAGVKSLRLGLYLPRKAESLTEAAKCLLDLIRTPRKPAAPVLPATVVVDAPVERGTEPLTA